MSRPLKRTEPSHKRQNIITIDIETDGFKGGFLYGAAADERYGDDVLFFDTVERMVDYIFDRNNRGSVFYAHNGQFDWRYLYQEILMRDVVIKPIIQGEDKIIGLTMRTKDKQTIRLKDSYALVTSNLDRFSKQFAPEYAKGHIDFDKETFDKSNPEHIEYLRNDVLGLLHGLQKLSDVMIEAFDSSYSGTAASTAMRVFRSTIPDDVLYWRLNQRCEAFCREAYYGGRVYIRDINEHLDCTTIDVNAMYATAMREGVPYGSPRYTTVRSEKPGIFRVKATCPESLRITLLPKREHGLIWFHGSTETVVTTIEIDKALALGYEIEILEGYEFDGLVFPFNNIVDMCENIEKEHKGSPIGDTAKLMRNSLYGKFGTKAEHNSVIISDDCPDGYGPVINQNGSYIENLWSKTEIADDNFIHPEWAAWITANARLELYRHMEAIGVDNVLYTDTDSVTAPTAVVEQAIADGTIVVGKEYGMVKREKEWETFTVRAPKVYLGELTNGKAYSAQKGIPAKLAAQAFAGGPVSFDSPVSLMSTMKGQRAFGVTRTRTLTNIAHSRGLTVMDDGTVRAVTLSVEGVAPVPRAV